MQKSIRHDTREGKLQSAHNIKLVLQGLRNNWSTKVIARSIGCSTKTVTRIIKKYPELHELAKEQNDMGVREMATQGDLSLTLFMGWMRLVHSDKAKEIEVYVTSYRNRLKRN